MARGAKQSGPIRVMVDTREQRPWTFDGDVLAQLRAERSAAAVEVVCERGTLDTGDYALVEAPEICRIERKSLGDFVGSVTHDHERFMREMARMRAYPIRAVVVEADLAQVVSATRQARPHSVVASALKCLTDFGVAVQWANCRAWAEWQAAWILRRAWEKHVAAASTGAEALDWSETS